jgi:hypothetical protein
VSTSDDAYEPDPSIADGEPEVVNYHFPVELHAVGSLPDSEFARLAGEVFGQLDRELASRL